MGGAKASWGGLCHRPCTYCSRASRIPAQIPTSHLRQTQSHPADHTPHPTPLPLPASLLLLEGPFPVYRPRPPTRVLFSYGASPWLGSRSATAHHPGYHFSAPLTVGRNSSITEQLIPGTSPCPVGTTRGMHLGWLGAGSREAAGWASRPGRLRPHVSCRSGSAWRTPQGS